MGSGRTKEPNSIKHMRIAARGQVNPLEPKPSMSLPNPPSCLDELAREKWGELAEELHRIGVLTLVDGDTLAMYCQEWSRWQQAEEMVKYAGVLGEDDKLSPYLKVSRSAAAVCQALGKQLGLNPASRVRICARPSGDQQLSDTARELALITGTG